MSSTEIFKYQSFDVALIMMREATKKHISLNQTKVQKFLYILYSVYLVLTETRLTDEHPKAWPYGPVFPTVRCKILKNKIPLDTFDFDEFKGLIKKSEIENDTELLQMCDTLFSSRFAHMSTTELVSWTHIEGAPWEVTTNKDNFKWGDIIPDELILQHYKRR